MQYKKKFREKTQQIPNCGNSRKIKEIIQNLVLRPGVVVKSNEQLLSSYKVYSCYLWWLLEWFR